MRTHGAGLACFDLVLNVRALSLVARNRGLSCQQAALGIDVGVSLGNFQGPVSLANMLTRRVCASEFDFEIRSVLTPHCNWWCQQF